MNVYKVPSSDKKKKVVWDLLTGGTKALSKIMIFNLFAKYMCERIVSPIRVFDFA